MNPVSNLRLRRPRRRERGRGAPSAAMRFASPLQTPTQRTAEGCQPRLRRAQPSRASHWCRSRIAARLPTPDGRRAEIDRAVVTVSEDESQPYSQEDDGGDHAAFTIHKGAAFLSRDNIPADPARFTFFRISSRKIFNPLALRRLGLIALRKILRHKYLRGKYCRPRT